MTAAAGPLQWQQCSIERIARQTPRVVSVFLQPPIPTHDPGQHVDVRLTAPDGYRVERSYSIASAPGARSLELAIERLDDGEVSPYFHDVAQAGDTVEVRGPIGGHFVWRHEDGGPLLLAGGGSGVVPFVSMVRYRASIADRTPTLLVYSARTWDEIVFREELLNADERDDRLTLVFTTTRGVSPRAGDYQRRLDREVLHGILARWGHAPRRVYICGANRFVESVASSLVLEGLPPESIRTERYGGA
jgi:ferredoxin-NADP reductase